MTNSQGTVQAQSAGVWLLYALSCLWLGIAATLWAYSHIDYGYAFWYDQLEIGDHIRQYASQHPTKSEFADLPKTQHLRAFAEISRAVHKGGEGLESIAFSTHESTSVHLLDRAEILHLQDVANLIEMFAKASWLMVLVLISGLFFFSRRSLPSWRFRLGACVGLAASVTVLLLVAGPRDVFYQLHVWVFPPEHQWFFYWEQSLMSSLMKAPVLFGGIAVVLAGVGIPLGVLLYLSVLRLAGVLTGRKV